MLGVFFATYAAVFVAEIVGDKLRIRRDHVLEDMLRGLGAHLSPIEAPFDPEGGAYGHSLHEHGHGS